MIRRTIAPLVEEALDRQAVVALTGPRQVGKTTLALETGERRNALYLDLEDQDDRNKLHSPALFFEACEDRLVILDEIHRMPGLFDVLRGVVDRGRRKGKGKGRFLVLGSASVEVMRQSETLAGRIAFVEMTPLTAAEVVPDRMTRERLWLRGGFPDSFLARNDGESLLLRKDFIRTFLERDVLVFGPRIPSATLARLWTMLAHSQGALLNASSLARSMETSTQSVTRYIDLLCDLLLVRRLQPLHANVGKRLVRSPKVYIRDSGLLHALLGLETLDQLAGHPVMGQSWEGWVIENLLAAVPWRTQASFYRTAAGAEADLVLDFASGRRWVIEIKRGLSARLGRGFFQACADLNPDRAFAVHGGDDSYPAARGIEAVSVLALVRALEAASEVL